LSIPFRLLIPRRLYDRMVAQAIAELPNECCGVLAGWIPPGATGLPANQDRGAIEYYPLKNALASPKEYESEPESMFKAVRAMRRQGLEILAVFHSHPTSNPVPSRTDLERSYGEEVMNLILSLKAPEPVMRGWWFRGGDFEEAEWCLMYEWVVSPDFVGCLASFDL
jgi:[CysO sulfur-carrier protein]-S-L-cysteine hydrolase